jgi:hypothetical protein
MLYFAKIVLKRYFFLQDLKGPKNSQMAKSYYFGQTVSKKGQMATLIQRLFHDQHKSGGTITIGFAI